MLSRVIWPRYELKRVLEALQSNGNKFQRICIQAVNYPNVLDDLCELITCVQNVCKLPISVSCQPLKKFDMQRIAEAGAERLSVALDVATPELFERIKGSTIGAPYSWDGHLKALEDARSIFGSRVSTHLIVGLGENEREMVETIQILHDRGITVALFAFTPIAGTPLAGRPRPNLSSYRRIQLAHYLIVNNLSKVEQMRFEKNQLVDFVQQDVLNKTIESGEPFRTSGCPGCNRPFYNESPRGPIYNHPRKPKPREILIIRNQLLES